MASFFSRSRKERGARPARTSGGGSQGDAVTGAARLPGRPCRARRGSGAGWDPSAAARFCRMFIYLCKKVLLGRGGGRTGGVPASPPGNWERGGLGALRGPLGDLCPCPECGPALSCLLPRGPGLGLGFLWSSAVSQAPAAPGGIGRGSSAGDRLVAKPCARCGPPVAPSTFSACL